MSLPARKLPIIRRLLLVGGVLLLNSAASPFLRAGEAPYTPTMKDMMSINTAVHNYMLGLEKHDQQAMARAFTEDGTFSIIDHGRVVVKLTGRDQIGHMNDAPPGPPPNASNPGAPPPAPAGAAPSGGGDIWHFIANDYFEFQSPTHATHYAYWMDVHPGEKTSTMGVPGHYDDVLVKQNGEWLFKQRTVVVGDK